MHTIKSNESTRPSPPSQKRVLPRRAIWRLSIALLGLAALLLAGCGGDDSKDSGDSGSSESFVISINGAADITFTDSDQVFGFYSSTEVLTDAFWADSTAIFAGSFGTPPGGLVTASGSSTGTDTIAGGNAYLSYTVSSSEAYIAADAFGVTGSVTITEYGSVGGYIKGTFTVTDAVVFVDSVPTGATATLDGSFSAIREADDPDFGGG